MTHLLVLVLLALALPATAQEGRPAYDPSVPHPVTPLDVATASLDACGAWLDPIAASYGRLRIQYPLDNVWYYETIETSVARGGETLTIQDTSTSRVKAGGPVPDPKLYTTVELGDLDPGGIAITEVLPFETLLGPKSPLGRQKAEYAAYYAEYVLPAWYARTQKPATKKVWKVVLNARDRKPLFAQVHYGPSTAAEPNKKTDKPPVASVGLYFSDKGAADEAAKVLRRMAELGR